MRPPLFRCSVEWDEEEEGEEEEAMEGEEAIAIFFAFCKRIFSCACCIVKSDSSYIFCKSLKRDKERKGREGREREGGRERGERERGEDTSS